MINEETLLKEMFLAMADAHACPMEDSMSAAELYGEGCSAITDVFELHVWQDMARKIAKKLTHVIDEVPV